jgi:hypothetical protein
MIRVYTSSSGRVLIPDAGSRPLRQGQDEGSGRVAERNKAIVEIETLRLFILGINDKSVHGDFGPTGTLYGIPQQGTPEFTAMKGESDGKAPQARDGYGRIAWLAFDESEWHLREKNPARGQCIEPGNPICRDLVGHEARGGAAAHILASLLPEIAIERVHPAPEFRTIMAWPKWLYDE